MTVINNIIGVVMFHVRHYKAYLCSIIFFHSLVAKKNDEVHIQIGEAGIQPSVIHGMCTVCKSNRCTDNCFKCSTGFCVRDDRDCDANAPCTLCNNRSAFCSRAPNTIVEANKTPKEKVPSRRCCLGCESPLSVFVPRSQGANTARELAGWEEFIHQYDVGGYYLTTGTVLGYSHSLHPERIAHLLFGDSVLHFAGSQVADRPRCAILADNFGLSPTFRGSLSFHPTIQNVIFDNQFFIGLDPILCGLYARIHAPLVWTRWDLGMCQTVHTQPCTPFPACAVGEDSTPATCDIFRALSGTFTFGDMKEPWHFGRFCSQPQTRVGLADIDLIVGYDRWQNDYYHFGFYGQVVCPTGNKPHGRTIFEPIVGNAKHWELGIGISGHLVLWSRDLDHSIALYIEGNATHQFKNTQMRSFDFCHNGFLSRYMLLKKLDLIDGSYQYAGNLVNAINVTTMPVDVSVAIKGDISAKISYRSPCYIVDLGYNFYGKTEEKIHGVGRRDGSFGIKGIEGVCALEYATEGTVPPVDFGPLVRKQSLNSTEHNATIRQPAATDNPQELPKESPTDIVVTAFSRQEGTVEGPGVIQAFASNPPILIGQLHKETGRMPAEATHKVFGYLGYNLYTCDWFYNPYIGIGGELELDARACSQRTALNQWSVWVKGGFEF